MCQRAGDGHDRRSDKRCHVCGSAHGFYDAGELIRKHQPDVLLIEPFLEDRDGICWIKDLAKEFPRIRILIVSRQSERIYAERALHAGAAGYWMKNGSAEELLRALETVAAVINGKLYAIGGNHNGVNLSTVEIYDPASNTWTSGTSEPTARYGAAAGVIGSKLYATGGYDATNVINGSLEVYTAVCP